MVVVICVVIVLHFHSSLQTNEMKPERDHVEKGTVGLGIRQDRRLGVDYEEALPSLLLVLFTPNIALEGTGKSEDGKHFLHFDLFFVFLFVLALFFF